MAKPPKAGATRTPSTHRVQPAARKTVNKPLLTKVSKPKASGDAARPKPPTRAQQRPGHSW